MGAHHGMESRVPKSEERRASSVERRAPSTMRAPHSQKSHPQPNGRTPANVETRPGNVPIILDYLGLVRTPRRPRPSGEPGVRLALSHSLLPSPLLPGGETRANSPAMWTWTRGAGCGRERCVHGAQSASWSIGGLGTPWRAHCSRIATWRPPHGRSQRPLRSRGIYPRCGGRSSASGAGAR